MVHLYFQELKKKKSENEMFANKVIFYIFLFVFVGILGFIFNPWQQRHDSRIENLFKMNGTLFELYDLKDVEFNDVIKQSHIPNFHKMKESDKSIFNSE